MFQLRRILLSGLVALMMVGFVMADDASDSNDVNEVGRSYIGTWSGGICVDSMDWKCIHVEITFIWEFPV